MRLKIVVSRRVGNEAKSATWRAGDRDEAVVDTNWRQTLWRGGVEGRCEDVLKMELPGWRRGAGTTGQDPAAAGGKGKTTEGKNKMNEEEPCK